MMADTLINPDALRAFAGASRRSPPFLHRENEVHLLYKRSPSVYVMPIAFACLS